jgi:hypothetical protein
MTIRSERCFKAAITRKGKKQERDFVWKLEREREREREFGDDKVFGLRFFTFQRWEKDFHKKKPIKKHGLSEFS